MKSKQRIQYFVIDFAFANEINCTGMHLIGNEVKECYFYIFSTSETVFTTNKIKQDGTSHYDVVNNLINANEYVYKYIRKMIINLVNLINICCTNERSFMHLFRDNRF